MASVDTPTPKQQLCAWMAAIGLRAPEIARRLGMRESTVRTLQTSPLFQTLVRDVQRQIETRLLDDVVERLVAEAPATLARLVELRDQGKDLRVALGAANSIADRIQPLSKKVRVEEERSVRVLMTHDVERLLNVIEEVAEAEGRPIPRRIGAGSSVPLDDEIDHEDASAEAEAPTDDVAIELAWTLRRPRRVIPGALIPEPDPGDPLAANDPRDG
jgi:hypothetical protein